MLDPGEGAFGALAATHRLRIRVIPLVLNTQPLLVVTVEDEGLKDSLKRCRQQLHVEQQFFEQSLNILGKIANRLQQSLPTDLKLTEARFFAQLLDVQVQNLLD